MVLNNPRQIAFADAVKLATGVTETVSCSLLSEQAQEPLAGTAPQHSRFVLVEVRQPWAGRPLDTELPTGVRQWLQSQEAIDGVRVGFIRRPRRRGPIVVYFADVKAGSLRRLEVSNLSDVASLEGFERGSAAEATSETLRKEPFVLVCTHGRRDACCAKTRERSGEVMNNKLKVK